MIAQGQDIFFNTRDLPSGIDVRFVMPDGTFASGSNLFVEVLAGADDNSLKPLTPLFLLNRTGPAAGYANPLSMAYRLTGWTGGDVVVAYRAFQGPSWEKASIRSELQFALAPVAPGVAPGPPTEVPLGTRVVALAPAFPQGDMLDQWTWRGPGIPPSLRGIAFGNGVFVAVGDAGAPSSIVTSADGHSWTPQVSSTAATLNAVAYGDGLFVAAGEAGTILTSSNGINWVTAPAGVTDTLTGVVYGQGVFVVCGQGGRVLSSTDSSHWERRESNTTYDLNAVAYGNGRFVLVGISSPMLVSTNGADWTNPTGQSYGDFQFNDLTFGNNLFVAVRDDYYSYYPIWTSPDGVRWSPANILYPCTMVHGVAYGAGTFVAVQDFGAPAVLSHDGTNWGCVGSLSTNAPLRRVAYGNNSFVAVGDLGAIFSSPDGVRWTNERLGSSATALRDVTWGNGVFVTVGAQSLLEGIGQGREILYSPSGVSWAEAPPTEGPSIVNSYPLNGVAFGGGKFVAVGISDATSSSVSTNGLEWFPLLSVPGPGSAAVAYGNGVFASVGTFGFGPPGQIAISKDGLQWNVVGPTNGNNLWGVAFGQDRFVAVGDKGAILASSNSIDWTPVPSGTSATLRRVTYGYAEFVAVGESGTILHSQDASSWSKAVSKTVNRLNAVVYGDGNYVTVGDDGTILTSTNALAWTARLSGTHNDLFGVAYGNDTFVVVGDHGTLLQSGTRPFTVEFDSVQAQPGGIEMHLTGESGRSYRIEASTNLVDWSEIAVETQPQRGVLLLDGAVARWPRRFYRAVAP